MRVVLVNMPWGALERPALGISLLKAGLVAQGVACEVRYLNMLFADLIGAERCRRITHDLPHIAFIGEWLFTEALYGPDAARDGGVDRRLRFGLIGQVGCRSLAVHGPQLPCGFPGCEFADRLGLNPCQTRSLSDKMIHAIRAAWTRRADGLPPSAGPRAASAGSRPGDRVGLDPANKNSRAPPAGIGKG